MNPIIPSRSAPLFPQKRVAEQPVDERAAKIAKTVPDSNEEAAKYQKKMSDWKIGAPLTTPSGDIQQGVFKVARETGFPGTIALVSSVYQSRKPQREAKMAEEELRLIRELQQTSHIPQLLDAFNIPNREYTMIQEHVGPNLFTVFLDKNNPARREISTSEIEIVAKKVLESLRDLHKKGVIHGDLKAANCSASGALFDFNLAGVLNERGFIKGLRYGYGYHPPENLLNDCSYPSSDMWALGCMLYELSVNTPFMYLRNDTSNLQYKINALHSYSERLRIDYIIERLPSDCVEDNRLKQSTNARCTPLEEKLAPLKNRPKGLLLADLITRLLQFLPRDRISAEEALKHPFFTYEPQDRSFRLQVRGEERLHLRILNNERQVAEVFNLPNCPPDSCRHISASTAPYCVEFTDPDTSQPLLHACNLSLLKDHLIVSVDTDKKEVFFGEQVPSPMDLSGSSAVTPIPPTSAN